MYVNGARLRAVGIKIWIESADPRRLHNPDGETWDVRCSDTSLEAARVLPIAQGGEKPWQQVARWALEAAGLTTSATWSEILKAVP